MIGYYVHHVGRGHLRRARQISAALTDSVTVLSSLPRPDRWVGEWLQLPRDDDAETYGETTAGGALHWAPIGDPSYRRRMSALAQWIEVARPRVLVVDVSVEVVALGRLLGVPVVAVAQPGDRSDRPHRLGYNLVDAVLAPWPAEFSDILQLPDEALRAKVHFVGAISAFDGRRRGGMPWPGPGRGVLLLQGAGGSEITDTGIARARAATPRWSWVTIGGATAQHWVTDPWPLLCSADVVVSHAGLGALADIAAARIPAVIIPQERPHEEQLRTAAGLADQGVAVVLDRWPPPAAWPEILQQATDLGAAGWSRWSDGAGAARAAEVIENVARNHEAAPAKTS